MNGLEAAILTIITASTPLLLAAIGELVVERSGVLNLGVEGMMVMGAVGGFIITQQTGSLTLGVIAAMLFGVAMSLLFGLLTQTFIANQMATGLALTILCLGLSGLIGENYTGMPGEKLPIIEIPLLSSIPFLGNILFKHDILVYISFLLVVVVHYALFHSRIGLIIRAVGDSDKSAHALGYNVVMVRYMTIMFGGACAGLAGGYLSLSYTPQWIEDMTAGRGWIALALVVFATWMPKRILWGAYLFGTVWIMGLYVQAYGISIPAQLLSSMPYVVTIVALIIISRYSNVAKLNTPKCLGQPFVADR